MGRLVNTKRGRRAVDLAARPLRDSRIERFLKDWRDFTMPKNPVADPKKWVTRMSKSLAECTPEATQYGKCISACFTRPEGVERDACAKEFAQLSRCMKRALAAQRGRA